MPFRYAILHGIALEGATTQNAMVKRFILFWNLAITFFGLMLVGFEW